MQSCLCSCQCSGFCAVLYTPLACGGGYVWSGVSWNRHFFYRAAGGACGCGRGCGYKCGCGCTSLLREGCSSFWSFLSSIFVGKGCGLAMGWCANLIRWGFHEQKLLTPFVFAGLRLSRSWIRFLSPSYSLSLSLPLSRRGRGPRGRCRSRGSFRLHAAQRRKILGRDRGEKGAVVGYCRRHPNV